MRIFASLAVATLFVCGQAQADVILFEDFEDSTISYSVATDQGGTSDDLTDISNMDYFGRIASDTSTPAGGTPTGSEPRVNFTNQQGTGYYGAQDTDAANSGDVDQITLTWTVNTSNYEDLSLSWYVAEDDSTDGAEDWDSDASFRITANGSQVFRVESELGTDGNETNEVARVDTDNDGVGDGTEITDDFAQFSVALADAASYTFVVTFEELNAGDEDFAFDNFLLEGTFTGIPEPTTFAMFALGLGTLVSRRRRS